jgi:hypothetical protein
MGDGLKDCDSSIAKVRNAVRYVKSSPNRFQTFKNFVKTLGIESKSHLCLDIATRWNSTYIMLESAVKFDKVFLRMDFEDEGYNTHFHKHQTSGSLGSLDVSDFYDCKLFVNFLKLFYYATNKFFDSLYVTSNTFFMRFMSFKPKLMS